MIMLNGARLLLLSSDAPTLSFLLLLPVEHSTAIVLLCSVSAVRTRSWRTGASKSSSRSGRAGKQSAESRK